MAKTTEEKKKEIAARREALKEQLKKLNKQEREIEGQAKKADRVARNRAMYILAGLMLEDMKRAKDVARIQKLAERVTRPADKEKFALLIAEVQNAK